MQDDWNQEVKNETELPRDEQGRIDEERFFAGEREGVSFRVATVGGMEASDKLMPSASASKGFRKSTLLLPLGLMLLHMLVLNLSALGLALRQAGAAALTDQEAVMRALLDANLQSWATIVMALFLVPLYIWIILRKKKQGRYLLTWQRPRTWTLAYGVLGILASMGVVQLFFMLLERLGELNPWLRNQLDSYQELIGMALSEDGHIALAFLALVVAAPVVEDLLFRGIILEEFRAAWGETAAVLLSAFCFAVFHANFVQSAYVFIPGLILGLAYVLSRNILVPIALHMCFNFLGGFVSMLAPEGSVVFTIIHVLSLAALAAFVLLTLWTWRQRRRQAA